MSHELAHTCTPTRRGAALCFWIFALALPHAALPAQETDPVAALRAEIEALRQGYETRLAALEARLASLETGRTPSPADDELTATRAAAEAAARAAEAATAEPPEPTGRRSLNTLNPEVSFTGNVLALASDGDREEFSLQEFELDLQAALDPFTRTRWTLAFEGEEVGIEEGYITYTGLPGGLELSAGKFRQQLGPLNRQHLHALPQTGYPEVVTTFFGEEGLAQTGLALRWLLPRPWASANEISLEITDGESEAFGGEAFESLAALAHLKSFWDLSPATYFEWGLSGIVGEGEGNGTNRVWGSDFTLHWQPPGRAKYRELTWRTEVLLSQRDTIGGRSDAWGGYSYLEGLLARNLYLGVRYDHVEDPLESWRRFRAVVPYLTWWQSEWVRLRAELQHRMGDLDDEEKNRFLLQVTFAAGPHKHETY